MFPAILWWKVCQIPSHPKEEGLLDYLGCTWGAEWVRPNLMHPKPGHPEELMLSVTFPGLQPGCTLVASALAAAAPAAPLLILSSSILEG